MAAAANRTQVHDLQRQVEVVAAYWSRTQTLLVETHNLAVFLKARFHALAQAVEELPAVFQAGMQQLSSEQRRLQFDLEKCQQALRDHRREIHAIVRAEPPGGFSAAGGWADRPSVTPRSAQQQRWLQEQRQRTPGNEAETPPLGPQGLYEFGGPSSDGDVPAGYLASCGSWQQRLVRRRGKGSEPPTPAELEDEVAALR